MTGRMPTSGMPDPSAVLTQTLEADLLQRYGPLIGQKDLRQVLGYSSLDAVGEALAPGQMPVPVFPIPNRRGKFALAKDVAHWMARLRWPESKPDSEGGAPRSSPQERQRPTARYDAAGAIAVLEPEKENGTPARGSRGA